MGENRSYNDSPTFIPARLESSVHGMNPVADAKDIYDINAGAWQRDINEQSVGYRKEIDDIVAAQTPLALNVTPTLIEAGVTTSVAVEASADLDNPEEVCSSIQILRGSTPVLEGSDVRSINGVDSYQPVTNGTTKYKAVFNIRGSEKTKEVNITAHYRIYYGFGSIEPDAQGNCQLQSNTLKSSPAGDYVGVSPGSGVHFCIAIPAYMSNLTSFTMGGAPFVMDSAVSKTYNGVAYKVYASGNSAYPQGQKLSVTAK